MYDTRAFFNERAAAWDKKTTFDPEKVKLMLHLCDISPDCTILDVGCGTGMLEPFLLSYRPAKIIAVDFAENMIRAAKKKIRNPAVEFVCKDIFDVSGLQCDYCFFYSAFPHFAEPQKLVAHVTTLLKAGGRLTISHTQGKKNVDAAMADCFSPMLPAQGLINLLKPFYRLDVIIDTNAMFLISGVKLARDKPSQKKK